MEIWTNGQQPKQEYKEPKCEWDDYFEKNKNQSKQIGCGTLMIIWIIGFCLLGVIFGGNM